MDPYEAGFEAGMRGEEAAPGCTATPYGHRWLEGYIAGVQARAQDLDTRRTGGRKVPT